MSENGTDSLLIKDKCIKNNNNHLKNEIACGVSKMHGGSAKGRKTIVFWTLVGLLLLLALGNLVLTLTIIGVLRLGYGMSSLELVPEESVIKFFGDTDLGHVYKVDGKLSGFVDSPVSVTGDDNGSVLMSLMGRAGRPINKLAMNRNGTAFKNFHNFYVRGPKQAQHTLSSNSPHFHMPQGAKSIVIKMTHANRIASLYNQSLDLRADSVLNLKGNEGTRMESKEIVWSADQDIYLKSVNGSLVFSGRDGISIDMKSVPIVQNDSKGSITTQFKLCVCIPHGKLFRIPVLQGQMAKVNCNHIKMTLSYNPCM